jgi:16S rRNA (uracil1498-N3)-methyltransferase
VACHWILFPDLSDAVPAAGEGTTLVVGGEEAHHAVRVKRLEAGDRLRLADGRGSIADATIAEVRKDKREGWQLVAHVERLERLPRPENPVIVRTGVPKGDRLEAMLDGLSQLGVAAWGPLLCDRTQAEGRALRDDRLERVCVESLKQCGRPWMMERLAASTVEACLGPRVLVADAMGEPLAQVAGTVQGPVTLLIGPEGGWSEAERGLFRNRGVVMVRFGAYTLRVETAAVVAAGMVLAWQGENA